VHKAIAEKVENAIKDTIEGVMTIEFWLNSDGTTSEHKVIRGIRKDIDDEILEIATHIKYKQPPKGRGDKVYKFSEQCLHYSIKFGSSKNKLNCWQRFFDFIF
jgi:hypothetical protein